MRNLHLHLHMHILFFSYRYMGCFSKPPYRGAPYIHAYTQFGILSYRYRVVFHEDTKEGDLQIPQVRGFMKHPVKRLCGSSQSPYTGELYIAFNDFIHKHTHICTFHFVYSYGGCFAKAIGVNKALQNISSQGAL